MLTIIAQLRAAEAAVTCRQSRQSSTTSEVISGKLHTRHRILPARAQTSVRPANCRRLAIQSPTRSSAQRPAQLKHTHTHILWLNHLVSAQQWQAANRRLTMVGNASSMLQSPVQQHRHCHRHCHPHRRPVLVVLAVPFAQWVALHRPALPSAVESTLPVCTHLMSPLKAAPASTNSAPTLSHAHHTGPTL